MDQTSARADEPQPKFHLGKIVATRHAHSVLEHADMVAALARHIIGDWGDLDEHDRAQNEVALVENTRLLSSYQSSGSIKFWIITEADRSVTTVLLPEDY
jgi:hypothetical protein